MPTISEIVSIYPIAQYLSQVDIAKGNISIDQQLPRKIYVIGKSVKRIFDDDPSDSTLTDTANYLYSLCGIYGQKALVVAENSGSVSPITPTSSLPLPIEFYVSAGTLIATGGNSVNIASLIGYNLLFNRGNIPQQQLNPGDGSNYFTWNRNTGDFFCFGNAQEGELFSLIPIG